jgi:hypothetical protein
MLTVSSTPPKGKNGPTKNALSWTGTTGSIDVFRDGTRIGTSSTGTYEDSVKGSGPWVYKVCRSDGTCSAEKSTST